MSADKPQIFFFCSLFSLCFFLSCFFLSLETMIFVEDHICLRLDNCLSNWFPFVEDQSQGENRMGS